MQSASLANGPAGRTAWDHVNWREASRIVTNLRQRIFRAARANDHRKVRSLQKLMLRSRSNILMSVQEGYAGQRRQEHARCGQGAGEDASRARGFGGPSGHLPTLASQAGAQGVHSEKVGQQQMSPPRHPDDNGPLPSSNGQERSRTSLGVQIRGLILRVSAGAKRSRCH